MNRNKKYANSARSFGSDPNNPDGHGQLYVPIYDYQPNDYKINYSCMEYGTTNTYGSYLSQETGICAPGINSTNGVRPIIKLKYNVKLEKTTDLLDNTIWHILS